jgi:hypothetical protein
LEFFHIFGFYPAMVYCDYFSSYLNNNAVPKLSKEQWQRMLNIVYMEAIVTATSECGANAIKNYNSYRQVKSLNQLTGRKKPYYLMLEMLKLSEQK